MTSSAIVSHGPDLISNCEGDSVILNVTGSRSSWQSTGKGSVVCVKIPRPLRQPHPFLGLRATFLLATVLQRLSLTSLCLRSPPRLFSLTLRWSGRVSWSLSGLVLLQSPDTQRFPLVSNSTEPTPLLAMMLAVSSLRTVFHPQPPGMKPQMPTHVLMPACLPADY